VCVCVLFSDCILIMFSETKYITLRSSANKDLFPNNTPYEFTNQLCTTLNLRNKATVAAAEIHLPLNFRINNKTFKVSDISQVLVLADIVDDSIIGDTRMNILKILTINKSKSANTAQYFADCNLNYFPLTRNSVNNIRIQIVSQLGDSLPPGLDFKPTDETFIVLHFK
jgi:hypothetical protein